jgi:MFS family permease
MMPLALFRSRTFSGANLVTLLLYAALNGLLFFLPFNLIQVQGLSPTAAGAALLPFILMMFGLSRWAGRLADRYGPRWPLVSGSLIIAGAYGLLILPGPNSSYWRDFLPAILLLGIGMGLSVAPLTTAVMGAVPVRRSGIASGVNNAVSRTAGLLAIAILGIVMLAAFNNRLDQQLARLDVAPAVYRMLAAERVKLAAASVPETVDPARQAAIAQAIDRAFVAGFRLVMGIGAGLALLGAGVAAWLIEDEAPLPPAGGKGD